jgi:signal transduction histidine kinase
MARSTQRPSLAARVLGGFLLALASFAAVSGYGVYKLGRFQSDLALVGDTYLELRVDITQIQADHGELTLTTNAYQPSPNNPLSHILLVKHAEELSDIQAAQGIADQARTGSLTAEDAAFLSDLSGRLASLHQMCVDSSDAFDAVLDPKPGEETAATGALNAAFQNQRDAIARLAALLKQRIDDSAHRLRSEEIAALKRASIATALVLLVGLGLALSSHFALRRLGRLAASAREIAHGSFRQRVDEVGPSDLAALATEFNKMAAALEEREQRLIRSERLATVGRISAQIAHEVRNPLSSIGLNAELLEEALAALPGDEARKLCQAIIREVDRLTTITEEYLRLARLPRPRLEREEPNTLVGSLLDFLRGELTSASITVDARLAEGLPAVAADENQLRQALLNLLRNAREAMPRGGTLTVETRGAPSTSPAEAGPAWVEIRVGDTGAGIPAEHLERIFEPFFSTKDGGTGLGLALTQQIAIEHGGTVSVESGTAGTTFTLRLPALPRPSASPEEEAPKLVAAVPAATPGR